MATVNKRVYSPQAFVINGIDAGGAMSVNIQEGYENVIRSSPDGLQVSILDKECQYVRGTLVSQDWIHIIELLTGTLGTYVFYERKSGVAEATGYIKHTLTNPIIHRVSLSMNQGGYATITADFECRAGSETATIADMHAMTDSQAAPTYVSAVRGGWRFVSAVYGASLNIHHVTGFNFSIAMRLFKACNDADIAYTAVDACLDGMQATGSINFQDSAIATAQLTSQSLLLAALANLVLTVRQAEGAANKIITIARASILTAGGSSDSSSGYTGFNASFEVANNTSVPLTLAGANKILTIADAA